ncbi:MAG: TonB-dependent receptor [Prolixibacteraceae bacterium]|nr:TonB-dependent receptor [Prolixibacteraceae bacterium]
MKIKIFTSLIFCFFVIIAFNKSAGQNRETPWQIRGTVTDNETGLPVDYAAVIMFNSSDSTQVAFARTDEQGAFSLEYNRKGDYYLVITFIGYEIGYIAPISLSDEKKEIAILSVQLHQMVGVLSEVEVLGRRQQLVYKLDKKILDVSGIISAAGGSAIDILEQMPSFRVDAEGELSFRGSSGFKVYIDNKPSSLDGSSALEQIPAGQIESIELITNPSARYEADGMAGIINIITKKHSGEELSGVVNATVSTVGTRGVDFMLANRVKNIRWNLAGNASRAYVKSDFDQMKKITISDTLTTTHATGERVRYVDLYSLSAGLNWYRAKTTWTAALDGRYRERDRGGKLHYEDIYKSLATGGERRASLNGSDFVNLSEWRIRGDVGFERRFDRQNHTLSGAFFAMYEGDAMEYFQTDLFDMSDNRTQGHKAWEDEYRFTAQGDLNYVLPFAYMNGKMETGYHFFSYAEDGDYTIDLYDPAERKFIRHDELYNRYLFRRDIHALYVMFAATFSRFSYQAGFREEYTFRKLGNNLKWAEHTKHTFDLFPSAHVAYDLKKNNSLHAAYSRRLTQPELFYMEPYVVYVDYYTAQRGNPQIKPEYINSMEISYNQNFNDNSFAATIFHRMRKDKIERVRLPYHTGVTLDSMANVGNDYATGIEMSAVLQLLKKWSMDVNGSLYQYRIKNEYKVDGEDSESLNWQLAVNNNFDVSRNTRIRLEAYYVGPSVSTQGRVNEYFYVNLSARQQFLKRRLTASLSVKDILSTAEYINTQNVLNMESKTKIYPRSPLVTLNLSYVINNFKLQRKDDKDDLFEGTNR